MSDLTTQSPAEIDQQLADLAEARATAVSRTYGFDDLRRYAKSEDRSRRLGRHDWVMSPAEAADVLRALLAAEAADDKYGYGRLSNGSEIGNSRRAVAAYDEYVAEMARIKDAEAPLTAEYVRRGGWQRYFLVTSSDGHVHRGMNCSTCRWETVYAWLIDLADCDEAKMVAEYGEKACTVCFPDAPTMDGWAESVAARLAEEAKIAEAFCPQGGQFQSAPAGHGWAKYVKCDHCGTTVSRTSTGKVRKHKKPEAA
jgi:hypothetical protein